MKITVIVKRQSQIRHGENPPENNRVHNTSAIKVHDSRGIGVPASSTWWSMTRAKRMFYPQYISSKPHFPVLETHTILLAVAHT